MCLQWWVRRVISATLWTAAKRTAGNILRHYTPSLWIRIALYTKNHNYEPELWYVPLLLSERSVAIDVGANEGIWSVQLARYTARVHAFEPNPICIAQLARVLPSNVQLHKMAVSDKSGTANLRYDPTNTGLGTIAENNVIDANPDVKEVVIVEVPVGTIDAFVFNDVGLIKIDVEGHEEAVVRGAEATLRRERPVFVIEVEERHNPGGLGRITQLFERHGYLAIVFYEGRLQPLSGVVRRSPNVIAKSTGINNFIFIDKERAHMMTAGRGRA